MKNIVMDKLTKFYSEASFYEYLDEALGKRTQDDIFSLCFLSKTIQKESFNDMQYLVLKQLANIVRMNVREQDVIGRRGSGIIIFMPYFESIDASVFAKKIKGIFDGYVFTHLDSNEKFSAVLDYKIAQFPVNGIDRKTLIRYLDSSAVNPVFEDDDDF